MARWTGLECARPVNVVESSTAYREVSEGATTANPSNTPPIENHLDHSLDHSDVVEEALANALAKAASAGRFDVVAQLAKEIEARRLTRVGNVITLNAARREKKGGA